MLKCTWLHYEIDVITLLLSVSSASDYLSNGYAFLLELKEAYVQSVYHFTNWLNLYNEPFKSHILPLQQ